MTNEMQAQANDDDTCFHCGAPLAAGESEVCAGCWEDPEAIPVSPDAADRLSSLSDTLMDPDTSTLHYQRVLAEFEALTEAMGAGWMPSLTELAQERDEAREAWDFDPTPTPTQGWYGQRRAA